MSETEKNSIYDNLHLKNTSTLLADINTEDKKIADAVALQLPAIANLVDTLVQKIQQGGRLFYIGAGTSGRLGILDASECPPTYGVPHDLVVGLIAGGDQAIRKAVEFAEDSLTQGYLDLEAKQVNTKDMVIGIAASGKTPYVYGALQYCQEKGIATGCIVCAKESKVAQFADFPVAVLVGPEYVTGSTRMKSGTAQKLVLNMITTATMIRLGYVHGNKMVDMQLSNKKLVDRGTKMVVEGTGLSYAAANELLLKYGNARKAILAYNNA